MIHHDAHIAATPAKHKAQQWQHIVKEAYYDLNITMPQPDTFSGSLQRWQLDDLGLSHLQSAPISYQRQHTTQSQLEDDFLLALPATHTIHFAVRNHYHEFTPGQYLLQHSAEKYHFECREAANMWVIRLPGALLRRHLKQPEQLCGKQQQPSQQASIRFIQDYLTLLQQHHRTHPEHFHDMKTLFAHQLTELCLALLTPCHHSNAIAAAHIKRIKQYALSHMNDPELSPQRIAAACQLSVRYFYALFQQQEESFHHWLTQARLHHAHHLLSTQPTTTILALALQCGFVNQSHFARLFKQAFGHTPSDLANKKAKR